MKVEGESMAPTLLPDDWALAVPVRRIRKGHVMVVEHPDRPGYEMVKRVTGVPGDVITGRLLGREEFWVQGDHEPASTDSRHFGPVSSDSLKARVILIYWPAERRRMLRR